MHAMTQLYACHDSIVKYIDSMICVTSLYCRAYCTRRCSKTAIHAVLAARGLVEREREDIFTYIYICIGIYVCIGLYM